MAPFTPSTQEAEKACNFKVTLIYMESSSLARATYRILSQNNNNNIIILLSLLLSLLDRVSLCSTGYPETYHTDQATLSFNCWD